MIAPTFLMCPPEFYDVVYEINPWMSARRVVDKHLAKQQWQALYDLLSKEIGAHIELVDPVENLPDMVFTANAGFVHKRTFVSSHFRHKERRGEERYFERWFRYKGYVVRKIEQPFIFEGAGDVALFGTDLITGYHFRSDIEAHDALSGLLKIPYHGLQLQDQRFYHLDTCFAPLNHETALMYTPAFEAYARLILFDIVRHPVEVPEDEALRFVCNAVVVGKHIVLPLGCPKTTRILEEKGWYVHALDVSEFMKAGGGCRCLVLKIQ